MLVVVRIDDELQDKIILHGIGTGNITCVTGKILCHFMDDETINDMEKAQNILIKQNIEKDNLLGNAENNNINKILHKEDK